MRTPDQTGPTLRVRNPQLASQFCAFMVSAQAPLPWDVGHDGLIRAANGSVVMEPDPDEALTDENALRVAHWTVLAVNTCGGFIAALTPGEG